MSIVIGLDVGGTTTKVVGFRGHELLELAMVQAGDPITAVYGGIGRFLSLNRLKLQDVGEVFVTGVGASFLDQNVLDLTTHRVDEFQAVGLGGLYLSGLEEAVVVSMGTGTSLVAANQAHTRHVIGTGVGGGTLLGLADAILGIKDFNLLGEMALKGDLTNVDLSIGDLSRSLITGLGAQVTASNFGALKDQKSEEDLAAGIVNLVFQAVGTTSILVSRLMHLDHIVFVGSLVRMEAGRQALYPFSDLYRKEIIIPDHAEYCTALGAALSGLTDKDHRWTYSKK